MFIEDGNWKARWNPDKTVPENRTLSQAEDEKFQKHETNSADGGLAFSSFVLCYLGEIGSQAVQFHSQFLCTLAFLELRQHDALRALAALEPPAPSDGFQVGPGVLDRRLS